MDVQKETSEIRELKAEDGELDAVTGGAFPGYPGLTSRIIITPFTFDATWQLTGATGQTQPR
jgi:hypothetical protein